MQLLIVRHAIAFERNARRWPDDAARPLSPAGMVRARKAAVGLKRLTQPPARVLASPLRRAQQTAEILTRFAGWPETEPCALLLPAAAPEGLLALLAQAGEERVAVVGHQPSLGRLLAACLPAHAVARAFALKKMSAALVAFRDGAQPARGQLLWLLAPKALRAVR